MFLPAVLTEGTRIGNCRVERKLGKGGFGITYLATEYAAGDTALRQVAIKEFFPQGIAMRANGHTVSPMHDVDGAPEAFENGLRAFYKEAQAIAGLDHENIIRLHSVFEANGTAYFVMPFLKGESLRALLRREGTLSEERLRRLLIPVLEGLAHAHKMGLLHRDIKPDNLMVREDNGRCVLIDFGTARAQAVSEATRYTRLTDLVAYTPGYAALEQYSRAASGNRHGAWTDLYAFGAVLAEAVTGQSPPESALRAADVHGGHPDPLAPVSVRLQDAPGYGRALLLAIDWALELSAKDRPQSIEEFRLAIDGRRMPPETTLRRLEAYGVATDPLTIPGWNEPARVTVPKVTSAPAAARVTAEAAAVPSTSTAGASAPVSVAPSQGRATAPEWFASPALRVQPQPQAEISIAAAPRRSRWPLIVAALVLLGAVLLLLPLLRGPAEEPGPKPAAPAPVAAVVAPARPDAELRALADGSRRKSDQLLQRASRVIRDQAGQPDSVLREPLALMKTAEQALTQGDAAAALEGYDRAAVQTRTAMQAFLKHLITTYGELARTKMAAEELDTAQAALAKAREVEGLYAEFK